MFDKIMRKLPQDKEQMKTYFTSDTHLGHKNILKYCNRPFKDVDEMDNIIINNWNSVVMPNDTIYHLGDFCFGRLEYYAKRLNGKKYLIRGNHDHNYKDKRFLEAGFEWVKDLYELKSVNPSIVLCHYAMRVWPRSFHGAWHLYGHSHGTLKDDPNALAFDVGVDCFNYYPISYEQVKKKMAEKIRSSEVLLDKGYK